jgi:hypothetical protein
MTLGDRALGPVGVYASAAEADGRWTEVWFVFDGPRGQGNRYFVVLVRVFGRWRWLRGFIS